jgi:thiol peroxidase
MISRKALLIILPVFMVLILGCGQTRPDIPVDEGSIEPGSTVARKGKPFKLLGEPIAVGDTLPSVQLRDATTMEKVDLSTMRGSILFLSIVPSLDTPVCDAQTHYLGEEGDKLPQQIKRITISRDTPLMLLSRSVILVDKEGKVRYIQVVPDFTHLPDMEKAFEKAEELLNTS